MVENDKQTPDEEGREITFAFRLSKEDRDALDKIAKKLAMGNKTNFLIGAIQRFKDHPEQWNVLEDSFIKEIVTKKELKQTKEEILQKQDENIETLLKTQEIILQMRQLIIHQQENSHTADLQEEIKTKLLNYENLSELSTYKSVEEFLIQEFPDKEQEIIEDKIYNEILLELMQEGDLKYNIRSKTLKWSEKKNAPKKKN